MSNIKGLYIEDEVGNIKTYSRFFKMKNIEIKALASLFKSPDEYYDYICDNDIDFVVIDNHLDKSGVNYDGFDVLKEIRKQDNNIYILLLTNFDYNDKDKKELGELDQTVKKDNFVNEFNEIISRIERASLRQMSNKAAEEIKLGLDIKLGKISNEISALKEINNSLQKIITEE